MKFGSSSTHGPLCAAQSIGLKPKASTLSKAAPWSKSQRQSFKSPHQVKRKKGKLQGFLFELYMQYTMFIIFFNFLQFWRVYRSFIGILLVSLPYLSVGIVWWLASSMWGCIPGIQDSKAYALPRLSNIFILISTFFTSWIYLSQFPCVSKHFTETKHRKT